MIINKISKDLQTRSDMPNKNWLGNDWVVVPDGSELSQKAEKFFPRFDIVFDENNNVVDIVEVSKTELELKQDRLSEIDKELKAIDDTGMNRYLEDIIEHTGILGLMFSNTKKVIENKKVLREERKSLVKEVENLSGGE